MYFKASSLENDLKMIFNLFLLESYVSSVEVANEEQVLAAVVVDQSQFCLLISASLVLKERVLWRDVTSCFRS